MRKKRPVLFSLLFLFLLAVFTVYLCNRIIDHAGEGKLYSNTAEIPFNKVGLVLGTSKFIEGHHINPYYGYRIQAAADLIKANKVAYLIVSGDNSRADYNEPKQMMEDLIKAGVDSSHIYPDYAGFRTFDSMVRAKEVFGQDSVTIVSQKFHNERALYIASEEGIKAIGFNAKDVNFNQGYTIVAREKLARVKVFLDYLTDKKPKFLGAKVIIP